MVGGGRTEAFDVPLSEARPSEHGGAPTMAFLSCFQQDGLEVDAWSCGLQFDIVWKTAVNVLVCSLA